MEIPFSYWLYSFCFSQSINHDLIVQLDQIPLELRPKEATPNDIFATPILRILLSSSIQERVSVSFQGAPSLSSKDDPYRCSVFFDTAYNRLYPISFQLLAQSCKGWEGSIIPVSERRDDNFSIIPSLQASLQSRKRLGDSIKVSCSYSSVCYR